MTSKKRGRSPSIKPEQIVAMREEYRNNPLATVEYLSDKYVRSTTLVWKIVANRIYPDPNYEKPKKNGGIKRGVHLPEHILEYKDHLTPYPTTAHRARGQNYTINKFK